MSKIEQFFFPQAVAAEGVTSKEHPLHDAAADRGAYGVVAISHDLLPERSGRMMVRSSAVAQAVEDAPQATGALISYIQRRYHDSHRQDLAELICLGVLVEACHSSNPDAPHGIIALLSRINTRLSAQIKQDENVLFPLMLSRARPKMALLISQADAEHHALLDLLGEIRELTKGYKAPATADAPWRALCFGAQEFAQELTAQISLKAKVLFPRFA